MTFSLEKIAELIGAIGMYLSTPILKKSGDVIENFGFSLGTGF